jgi:hypothetical protein
MTPVVIIATHKRVEITCRNIESLQAQSVVPKIVIVCSLESEADLFCERYDRLSVIVTKNNPIGAKWQQGVMWSEVNKAPFIIITGSDDILGKGFIEQAQQYIEQGYDFIGVKRWYVHDVKNKKVHLLDYRANLPLGGGRVYSKAFLDRIDWKLFEPKDKHLDDFGWKQVKDHAKKIIIDNDLKILSVKGDWPVMNPVEKMLSHPNSKLLKTYTPEEILKEFYG